MNTDAELRIERDKPLQALNTLGFSQTADYFIESGSNEQLVAALSYAQSRGWPVFVLGGGSNIVLTRNLPGLTIQLTNQTIQYDPAGNEHLTRVTASAGVPWHNLVTDTLEKNLRGLENLSLIPGSVGAAPVQNIGAYGVELQSRLTRVQALHIDSLQWREFTQSDCEFSYRHSFFKKHANQYVITEVEFELGNCHDLHHDYASLAAHLSSRDITHPNARQISESVIATRQARLPDPARLPNAGSFFHNPVVSRAQANQLTEAHPGIVTYDAGSAGIKVSAAWMIEKLGFKGIRRGNVGVHDMQSLVLVHHQQGTGDELLSLANEIAESVMEHFGIQLHIEPTIL